MSKRAKNDPTVVFMTADMGPFKCGHCRHYDRPHFACELVEGNDIKPRDCCNLYQPSEAHKAALAKIGDRPISIVKYDRNEQVVYGWGSIVVEGVDLITDRQGDKWEPDELLCTIVDFMENCRDVGVMHKGKEQGTVVQSFVTHPDLMEAFFGQYLDDEMLYRIPIGWMLGVKVSPEVMQRVYDGELTAFSIQGNADRIPDGE